MNANLKSFYALLATLPLTVGTLPVSGVVLGPVEPTADTVIRSFTSVPVGDASFLSVATFTAVNNNQRTLLLFDLASIPSDATIDSATLTLTANEALGNNQGNPSGAAMDVYRITQPWVELSAIWTDSGSGAWTAGGAYVGNTGVRDVSPYASNNQTVPDGYGTATLTWDLTGLVTEWVSGAQANNGLLIRSFNGNDLHFNSRSGAEPGPLLEVNFTPIPEPMGVGLLSCLALAGFAGFRRYRRQAS
jgi:hypothetical protein